LAFILSRMVVETDGRPCPLGVVRRNRQFAHISYRDVLDGGGDADDEDRRRGPTTRSCSSTGRTRKGRRALLSKRLLKGGGGADGSPRPPRRGRRETRKIFLSLLLPTAVPAVGICVRHRRGAVHASAQES
jgi:hypothetical protein